MSTPTLSAHPARSSAQGPFFVHHPSFEELDAEAVYGGMPADLDESSDQRFLPDAQTRDYSRRMHYAAYRLSLAESPEESLSWKCRYLAWRDRIVLGNLKLVYRAVHRWGASARLLDDWIAECQVVLIQAVAGFNPWVGIRFSTYAYTCLVRALSKQTTRQAADHLARALSLEALAQGERLELAGGSTVPVPVHRLDEYFQENHPLLSEREKLVLERRFRPGDPDGEKTLEEVGHELGVSRETVRRLQVSGLDKLRKDLLAKALAG